MVSYEKYSHNKLLTHMFSRLPARAVSVADTNFVCGTQKMFLILFRNILWPQHRNTIHFVSHAFTRPRIIINNNVSSFARALASYSVRALDILMFDVVCVCLINSVHSSDMR